MDEGIAAVDKTRLLVAQVAAVESEYAKGLRKVVKSFAAPVEHDSTQNQAWKCLLESLEDVANAHDNSAAQLVGDISNNLRALIKNKQKEREDISRNIARLEGELAKAADEYDKAKKKFEKADKEAELAKQSFLKMEDSQNVTKKQVEKARQAWAQKAKASEAVQQSLAQQTTEFNQVRTLHFHTDMPAQFDALQSMDQNRSELLVQSFSQIAKVYKDCGQHELSTMQRVEASVARHDKIADSQQFARAHCSGHALPGDVDVPAMTSVAPAEDPRRSSAAAPAADDDDDLPPPPPPDAGPVYATPGPATITYRALYAFPGTNQGELPISENDVLYQIENDGSGWVLVAKADGARGYVPETYIARM